MGVAFFFDASKNDSMGSINEATLRTFNCYFQVGMKDKTLFDKRTAR
jgi:hypothetical protein